MTPGGAPAEPPAPPSRLARDAASGARWNVASTVTTTVLRMGQTAILARLLAPGDFGLMGMALTVVGLGRLFAEVGLAGAVIPRQEVDPRRLSSLYWTNVCIGPLVFGLVAALSPLAASFYGQSEVSAIILIAATIFLISPFGLLHRTLLQKDLQFRTLSLIDISSEIFAVLVAVAAGVYGLGVYALVAALVGRDLVAVVLLAAIGGRRWKPTFHWARQDLDGYISFGLFQLGNRSLNFFAWSVDKILIGRLLGDDALGYYQIAWNLMLRPMAAVSQLTNRLFLPIFARMQGERERLGRTYLRVLHFVAFPTFPIYLGLFVLADDFIALYLGPGWQPSADILRILVLLGMLHTIGSPLGSLLNSIGRANAEFWMNLVVLLITIPAVMVGSQWGARGIAAALLIVELGLFYPLEGWLRWKLIGLSLPRVSLAVVRPLLLSALMASCVATLHHVLHLEMAVLRLVVLVGAGGLTYALLVLLADRAFLDELRSLWRARS